MTKAFKITSRGQGPELMLLHGWAMHSGIWGGVIDALATEFRVNLVDLPGHGINRHIPLSRDLDTVAELILSEVPPAAWVGWSLGGLVSLAAALQQPDKVQKLALVNTTPSFSRQQDWEYGVDEAAQQAFAEGLESDLAGMLEYFSSQVFGANLLREALDRLGGSSFIESAPDGNTLHTGLHLLYNNNLLPGLGTCKIPVLFLGGSRDRTVNPESLSQAASRMPDARACLITGARHAPFISHEDKFLDIIRGFLQEKPIA